MKDRRSYLAELALGGLVCTAALACATTGVGEGEAPQANMVIEDPPRRPGAKALLIAMPALPDFIDARKGLVTETQKDFDIVTFVVTRTTRVDDLAAAIERIRPAGIVVMNNATLALFQKYQSRPGSKVVPAIVLMTSFLEEAASRVKNITGIAYEVPAITGLIHMRVVLSTPINRVGVVFRPPFAGFVSRQKSLAAREHIEIVPVAVPADVSADQLRETLHTLTQVRKVDAIWMLNDNGLIRDGSFISATWSAALHDVSLPLLVGVPNLVDPRESFGTLAVVPDHEALGLQAANLIFDLAENDWNVGAHAIELPLAVKTVVDVKQVRERFGLKPNALHYIDRALEQAP